MTIVRLAPDGSLDPSFGGAGVVRLDLGVRAGAGRRPSAGRPDRGRGLLVPVPSDNDPPRAALGHCGQITFAAPDRACTLNGDQSALVCN